MIQKLKYMIDECEHNPKLKSICLQLAGLPESEQEQAISVVKELLSALSGANIYKCECGYMYKHPGYCLECGKKLNEIDNDEYNKIFRGNNDKTTTSND